MTTKSMELSIRRSLRRTKKKPDYSIGDVVEIIDASSDNVVRIGRLAARLTDSSSSNRRWSVILRTNDGTEVLGEHVFDENEFGEIMDKRAPKNSLNRKPSRVKALSSSMKTSDGKKSNKGGFTRTQDSLGGKRSKTPLTGTHPEPSSSPSNTGGGSDTHSRRGSSKKQKTVTFDNGNHHPADRTSSDSSQQTDNVRKPVSEVTSARDVRVIRRQAVSKKEVVKAGSIVPQKSGKQRQAAALRARQKGRFVSSGKSAKSLRSSSTTTTSLSNSDVIRVPMLTGTLFLYRGTHRRAEFVRSV